GKQSTIAPPSPPPLPKWPRWRASKPVRHGEWQESGWGQRASRFGFYEQASVHNCAANSCDASAPVWVCGARTCYLKPDSHFHPPTMLHFLSPAEWRLPPPHTQLRSTPPGRSKPLGLRSYGCQIGRQRRKEQRLQNE